MPATLTQKPASNVLTSGNDMWFTFVTDTPLTSVLRLVVVVNIQRVPGGMFDVILPNTFNYDPISKSVFFDVHEIVAAYLNNPDLGYFNGIGETRTTCKFYVNWYEVNIPDPAALAPSTNSEVWTVIKANIDRLKASELSFYSYQNYFSDKFLTEMPRNRTVFRGQAIALSFTNLLDAVDLVDFVVNLNVRFDDDYGETIPLEKLGVVFANVQTLIIDDSYFSSPGNPSAKVVRLSVSLNKLNTDLSETQLDAFIFQYRDAPSGRAMHFVWRNNVGGYDFLTATGLLEQKQSVSLDLYQKVVPQNDYTSQQGNIGETNHIPSSAYRVNTGMKHRDEISAFLSFFYSDHSFLIRKDQNENASNFWFVPVTKKLDGTFRKDKDYTNALSFDFAPSFTPNAHFVLK